MYLSFNWRLTTNDPLWKLYKSNCNRGFYLFTVHLVHKLINLNPKHLIEYDFFSFYLSRFSVAFYMMHYAGCLRSFICFHYIRSRQSNVLVANARFHLAEWENYKKKLKIKMKDASRNLECIHRSYRFRQFYRQFRFHIQNTWTLKTATEYPLHVHLSISN